MGTNLISIIIPCYNQAHYLKETVESAINQSHTNIEIIIVNDGSTDDTQQVAETLRKAYPSKIYVIDQKNQGLSEARNNGIHKSSGEYILPLDSDDIIGKEMLTKCLQIMNDYNVDVVSSDGQAFGERVYKINTQDFPVCNILYANCFTATTLFRRKVWEKTGGYKKNMNAGYEDWEFWINVYKHGFKFKRCPEILFYYRTKEESMHTEAFKKDAYLKAKMTINHPELYPKFLVKRAIKTIKDIENTSDIYFYCPKNMQVDSDIYLSEVANHLSKHSLKEIQIITINDIKIGLCSLELYENEASIQKLFKEMDVQSILFYAPLRYKVANLEQSKFAWTKGKGIEPAEGNIFPFVPKSTRENLETQLIAYQRLAEYQEKQIKTLDKKVSLAEQEKNNTIAHQKEIIRLQHETIEKKMNLLQNSYQKIIHQKSLIDSIQDVINLSVMKHPILKYKAYKSMVKSYYKYSNKHEGVSEIDKGITPHDIVFLIPTCKKYMDKTNAIRNTWAKQLTMYGFRHYFLMGNPKLKQPKLENDILYVPCEDNYESLLLKLVLGYEYLYQNMDFTYVYKIDDDCFPDLNKLINILLPQFNNKKYIGGSIHPKGGKMSNSWHFGKCSNPNFEQSYKYDIAPFDFAKGGYGYFLHQEILPIIIQTKSELISELDQYIYSYEDVRIAEVLYNQGISVVPLNEYSIVSASNYKNDNYYLVYDIQDPKLMKQIEQVRIEKFNLPQINSYITIEQDANNVNFNVKVKDNHKKVAFYLYKNNTHIDTQWYSKNMTYNLDKPIHKDGTYKVKYFLVHENDTDPANSTEKEIGESEVLYIK